MMKVIKTLFRKGDANFIKILCLSIGLALGLIMLSEVIYERSQDRFIPRLDDTYRVEENYKMKGEDWRHFPQCSGIHAPAIKSVCPEVEAATRFTWILQGSFVTEDQRKFDGQVFLCDSSFFEVFPRKILMGDDPHKTLTQKWKGYISDKLLKITGPDIVGKTIRFEDNTDVQMTVAGVFESLPENTHLPDMDIILSMPTIVDFFGGFDGSNNWIGNDRYQGYVRLQKGTNPDNLQVRIDKMMEDNVGKRLEASGVKLRLSLRPVKRIFYDVESNRIMNLVFLGFGLIMLLVAVFNYVLLVISSMVNRAKSIATYRCYGADTKDIYRMILGESFLHVFCIALPLAVLIIFGLRDFLQEQIGHSLQSLFPTSTVVTCILITLLVVIICGLLPGYLYSKIPVTYAYRRYSESKRHWKLGLLFLQFLLSSFFVCILVVIGLQYHKLTNADLGYSYKSVYTVYIGNASQRERELCLQELRNHPNVAGVTWGYQYLSEHCSGNNVYNPDTHEEYMNIADMYDVGDDYFSTLNIPLVEGRTFTEGMTDSLNNEVMVSRSFVKKMSERAHWTGSPIGEYIFVTEHESPHVIVGVYEDFITGSLWADNLDERPTVMYYNSVLDHSIRYLYIRLKEPESGAIQQLQDIVNRTITQKQTTVFSLDMEIGNNYQQLQHIKNSVLFAGICILLIALTGLIAYIRDEVNRRRSEIAIRSIMGATLKDLQRIFQYHLLFIAVPAILLGALLAWKVSHSILQMFAVKIALSVLLFGSCVLLILLLIIFVACLLIWKSSRANPIENLRIE